MWTSKAQSALTLGRGLLIAAVLPLALTACAPALRVTLLPEADGRHTAVVVSTAQGEAVLDAAYKQVRVRGTGYTAQGQADPKKLVQAGARLFDLKPAEPVHYRLLFQLGSTELRPDSKALLPEILTQAQAIEGGEVVVVGHTDALGSPALNDKLSLARAQLLRDELIATGFAAHRVRAVGRGSREPLEGTRGEGAEPANRRVEIWVR